MTTAHIYVGDTEDDKLSSVDTLHEDALTLLASDKFIETKQILANWLGHDVTLLERYTTELPNVPLRLGSNTYYPNADRLSKQASEKKNYL